MNLRAVLKSATECIRSRLWRLNVILSLGMLSSHLRREFSEQSCEKGRHPRMLIVHIKPGNTLVVRSRIARVENSTGLLLDVKLIVDGR
jgi:hypothetical protein